MSDSTADEEIVDQKRSSKLPLIIGMVLLLAGAGGGYFAVSSGLIGGKSHAEHDTSEVTASEPEIENMAIGDVAFVEIPQLLISLGSSVEADHLRFRASLEVPSEHAVEVESILPRVQDVLNTYLRAIEPRDLEAPGALMKLRGQMLRRIRLVVGEGRIRDLLVLEFVLN